MSGAFVVGDRLVSPEELEEKVAFGAISRFGDRIRRGKEAEIQLMSGTVTSADIEAVTNRPGFEPIGLGKPLVIEILTVYMGDAPNRVLGWVTGEASLLVTSGARGSQTSKSPPRAINQLVKGIGDREFLEPDAFSNGSPVIFYSPAMINQTTLTAYELVVDSFDHRIFDSISTIFAAAGGLPVFTPASGYLLAGSMLIKIFGKLGKSLLESDPFLRARINIKFDSPGLAETQASHIVLYNERDAEQFRGHLALPVEQPSGQERMRVGNKATREEYRGDAPYIIASLNGAKRNDLQEFAPTHASAELLEEFYRAESSANSVEVLGKALEFYKEGTRKGNFLCYHSMAMVFLNNYAEKLDKNSKSNAFKCWDNFFREAEKNPNKMFRVGTTIDMSIATYIAMCLVGGFTVKKYQAMLERRDNIFEFIEYARTLDDPDQWEQTLDWVEKNL